MKIPPPKSQKAVSLSLLKFIRHSASEPIDEACADLFIFALHYCMRSCEYLLTPKHEEKKTRIVVLGGVRFFKNNKILSFFDKRLTSADFVSVTFFDQKNGHRLDTRNVESVKGDTSLCCVRSLAETCRRIANYNHPTPILERPLCMFQNMDESFTDVTSTYALRLLRNGTDKMGFDTLGFRPCEVGTHSIRSGGAMDYFLLPELSDTAVMFKGRWKSTAFMRYIRPQVDQFMAGHATKIVNNGHWFNIPSLDPNLTSNIAWGKNSSIVFGGDSSQDTRLEGARSSHLSKKRPSLGVYGGRERTRRSA